MLLINSRTTLRLYSIHLVHLHTTHILTSLNARFVSITEIVPANRSRDTGRNVAASMPLTPGALTARLLAGRSVCGEPYTNLDIGELYTFWPISLHAFFRKHTTYRGHLPQPHVLALNAL